jgi:uncharacterized repeat protein (TIGR01451 family)
MENNVKFRFLSIILAVLFLYKTSSVNAQSYFAEANSNGFYLKKVVSDTVINTGQTFTYTIYFSIPAGATAVNVSDVIPASLIYHGYTVTAPCGTMNVISTPTVGSQGGTLTLNFPSVTTGCSGSISITVSFPNGVTCNNIFANNASCIRGTLGTVPVDICTKGINTQAKAVNPWHLYKYVLGTAYQGGNCPNVTLDSVITYRLYVYKDVATTGQLNMYSATVTDVLPAGAVLIGTPSGSPASPTVTQLGNTLTWIVGNLSAIPAYTQAYCDVQVYYPRATFPVGSLINNSSTLTGGLGSPNNPCGQANVPSNTTCVEIKPFASGVFSKTAYTTGQPGCGGYYWIQICNNGTLAINGFTVKDTLPTSLTTPSVSATSGGFVSNITSGVLTATYAGTLAPTQCAWIKVNFTIPLTATVGNNITNCAWMTSPSLPNAVQSCATFPVTAPVAQPCLWKEVCSKLPSYLPGQTFRYRLRVQNIGGQAMTGTTITDVLDANLQYVGNPVYYAATAYTLPCSSPAIPAGSTAWPGVTFTQAGQTLTWALPTIGATCQDYFWGNCGQYGTWGVPFYFIEFDVKVKNDACLGNIPNLFSISGGNVGTGVSSNVDYLTVGGTAAFNLDKTVSKDAGVTYASTAATASGTNVRFRLKFTPTATSTAAMRYVTFADLLPKDDAANDWYILNRPLTRSSAYSFNFVNTVATVPVGATTGYDATNSANVKVNNITIPSVTGLMFPYIGGTGSATWTTAAIPAGSKNIGYHFGATPIASPNFAQADFDAQVPANTGAQLNACNTFAGNAAVCHLINSNVMTNIAMAPSEAATACVTTTTGVSTVCCDSITIFQPDATTPPCCSRIQSKNCEIKSVTVSITNGTIGGVTFGANTATCFNNPSPAIGLTNYNFTPISGVCNNFTAQICPIPTVAGQVIVTYSFTFANGETCRKADTLKCEPKPECCAGAQIVPSQPTVNKCCSQLTSKCPVKEITVDIVGGVLGNVTFAGISAPLYTGLTGSSLTTASFGANATPVTGMDITVCPKLTANPAIVHYVLFFSDGTKCEKYDTLRCGPIPTCCDSVKIQSTVTPTGQNCCSRVTTTCPVKQVTVDVVSGGTIGNVSFAGTSGTLYTGLVNSALTTANFGASVQPATGLDITVCPKITTSPLILHYVFFFTNGEKCEKYDTLKCGPSGCCQEVKINRFDTQGKCCSQAVAFCPIKNVQISVSNGTIGDVSSAGLNAACYTGLTGSALTTANFPASCATNTGFDLTICPKPTTSPMIVTYTITFATGEICTKFDTLRCSPPPTCCDSVKIQPAVNSTGQTSCCSRVTTTCPVKQVTVNVVSGGTLGNVSFAGTSGTLYTGLVNSALTTANFGASVQPATGLDITVCPKITTSPLILHYVFFFTNGEKCEKNDTIKCTPPSCCQETQVVSFETADKCCSQVITTCPIKQITATVTNGTLGTVSFAGNSANLFTGVTGSTLTTANFSPSQSMTSGLDVTFCPISANNGNPIYINYVITYANGEVCEKRDTLNCITDCCKGTQVAPSPTKKCCSQLTTTCPVRSILVNVLSGGTLGDVTFAGATAGNYTGITGSALTSNNFLITSAGLPTAGMDITVCPKTTATTTIVQYTILFLNGQKCEKIDTIKCVPITECLITACYAYTATGLSVSFDGSTTTSNQPIVMYYWNFGDGTNAVTTTPSSSHNYTAAGTFKMCMTVYTNFGGSLCICTKEYCRDIKVAQGSNSAIKCTTGLTNTPVSEIGKIVASPNPSAENFHVKLENATDILSETGAELKVLNIQGTLIFTKKLAIGETEMDIQAQSFPAGLYFVSLLKQGEVISTIKVVKN